MIAGPHPPAARPAVSCNAAGRDNFRDPENNTPGQTGNSDCLRPGDVSVFPVHAPGDRP